MLKDASNTKPVEEPKEQADTAPEKSLPELFRRSDWNYRDSCYYSESKNGTILTSLNATSGVGAGRTITQEGKAVQFVFKRSLKLTNYIENQRRKATSSP